MSKTKKMYAHKPRSPGAPDTGMGHRLRLRRIEQGMSQSDLAERLGVSFQQVQKYEKGVTRISATRLPLIATALQVPVSFFYEVEKRQVEVESLLFLDSGFSLRLLRAYSSVKSQGVQRQFVNLIEGIAAAQE